MQQIDPWDIPHPSSRGAPQPLIPRQPSPQTADQVTHDRLANEALQQTIDANNQRLDPASVDMLAHQYILAGPDALRSLGGMSRIAAANRMAVLNRATQIAGVRPGEDIQVGFARYKNGVRTIGTLENQLGTISTNESTAMMNGQQFLDAIRRVYPSNSTQLGNAARAVERRFVNDPDYAAYESARNTFLTEYAKVVAGTPAGGGTLSDSARREQQDVLRNTASPEAAEAALAQMQRDMRNRILAYQNNIQRGYTNLAAGRPVNFAPNGDMLDDHGNVVPAVGGAAARNDSATPPLLAGPSATPPPPSAGPTGTAPSGELIDTRQQTAAPGGPDAVTVDPEPATLTQTDPTQVAVTANIQHMLQSGRPLPEIRRFVQDHGIQVAPSFWTRAAQFRRAHPEYRGPWNVDDLNRVQIPTGAARRAIATAGASGPGAYTMAAGNMVLGQRLPDIVGATGGDADLARLGINEVESQHPLATLAGDVTGGALLYAGGNAATAGASRALAPVLPRLASALAPATEAAAVGEGAATGNGGFLSSVASPTGTFSARAGAGDAALGAYEGSGADPEHPWQGALEGAASAVPGGMVGRGVINSTARAVSPTGGALAPAYEEGVQPTIGQRMGGFPNRIEQAFGSIPIVGQVQRGARNAAGEQWELGGFNRTLRNLPGNVRLPSGTQVGTAPHAFAQDAFDRAYTLVHGRLRMVGDEPLQNDLSELARSADRLDDSSRNRFQRILNDSLLRRLDNSGGELSGSELQAATSEIRQVARGIRSSPSGDRELADVLGDLQGAISEATARHSPQEAVDTLRNINRGYAGLVRIENAANRGGTEGAGRYTPRGLLNAERREGGLRGRDFAAGHGLMTDYAESGLRLGRTLPDSGTAERLMTAGSGAGTGGALYGLGHFVSPWTAAPWVANTAATMPGIKQAINAVLAPNRPGLAGVRNQIQERSYLGGIFGAPAALDAYGQ